MKQIDMEKTLLICWILLVGGYLLAALEVLVILWWKGVIP